MTPLLPFFTFYGGKNRAAKHYPEPSHSLIIEPFAGSAGYAMRYPDRQVLLRDMDSIVIGTWQYLISVSERDILALPDITAGQTVQDLPVCQEARWLIGWWLNKGSAQPKRKPSSFMLNYPQGGPYWGERVRTRIAAQLPAIRHWKAEQGDYKSCPNASATWFIDPPYELHGRHYRHSSSGIDYLSLAAWCRSRRGQVLVCEADDAAWLPFSPLIGIDGNEGRQKKNRARVEALWSQ